MPRCNRRFNRRGFRAEDRQLRRRRYCRARKITLELIDAVADAAAKIAHPLDNADLDYWYRKRMAKVFTQRALAQVAGLELGAVEKIGMLRDPQHERNRFNPFSVSSNQSKDSEGTFKQLWQVIHMHLGEFL